MRAEAAVGVKNQVHRLALTGIEHPWPAGHFPWRERELAAVQVVKLRARGSVRPRLEVLREQLPLLPRQVVAVGVVTQLLELHGGHAAEPLEDVGGYVLDVRHGRPSGGTGGWHR